MSLITTSDFPLNYCVVMKAERQWLNVSRCLLALHYLEWFLIMMTVACQGCTERQGFSLPKTIMHQMCVSTMKPIAL